MREPNSTLDSKKIHKIFELHTYRSDNIEILPLDAGFLGLIFRWLSTLFDRRDASYRLQTSRFRHSSLRDIANSRIGITSYNWC